MPWLCAYSGARSGEITQLRGIDVTPRGDFYVMRLTPEAGSIKTGNARTVPLRDSKARKSLWAVLDSNQRLPPCEDGGQPNSAGKSASRKAK